DFLVPVGEALLHQSQQPGALLGARLKFHASVNVLRVFTENDHIDLLGLTNRRWNASKVTDRPQADIKVEHLRQRDIKRSHAAAPGCRQRTLDADEVILESGDSFVRQPAADESVRLFAGQRFLPNDLASGTVRPRHCGFKYADRSVPDVRPGSV